VNIGLRTLAFILLFAALLAVGSVRAAEREQQRRLSYWKIATPCFDNAGKWYTR
jgi:hypothetical protein